MNRRTFLATLGGTAAIGGAGYIALDPFRREHRLWCVRLNNTWFGEAEVDARVKRNGTVVHEDSYEIPGMDASPRGDEEPLYWVDVNSRLLYGWDTDPAVFTVESRRSDRDKWVSQFFGHVEATNIHATVDIYGSSGVAGTRAHEFGSLAQAKGFVEEVKPSNRDQSSGNTTERASPQK